MKKILKVIGWIAVPYIMIFVFWKRLNNPGRIAGIIYAVIALIIAISSGSNGGNTKTTTKPEATTASTTTKPSVTASKVADSTKQSTVAATKPTPAPSSKPTTSQPASAPAPVQIQEGTYQVGTDVKPGLYRTDGDVTYWARLKGLTGDLGDIIDNGNPVGPAVVEILPTDKAFETQGSGTWTKIDNTYHPQMLTSFGDGTYIVGKDIAPGTYKSQSGDGGYWARLSGFTGDLSQVLANGNPQGQAIVQILPTDKGFETSGNGTWTKVQ